MNGIKELLYYNTIDQIDETVLKLSKLDQYEQRTQEWLDARQKCISASDVSKALMQSENSCNYYIKSFENIDDFSFKIDPKKCCDSYSSKEELILKKCNRGKPFTGNIYTLHGQKYEQVISNIYSQLKQVDIFEFGLLIHPEFPFLGASPDGITADGVMIEIKCPPCRQVKNYPPLHYFHQMLLQLECTDLKECHYIDAHFVEFIDQELWFNQAQEWNNDNLDAKHHIYGIVVSEILESGEDRNVYAPRSVLKATDFINWKENTIETIQNETGNECKISYYKLHEYYISTVYADKEWVTLNIPEIEKTWNEILFSRTPQGLEQLDKKLNEKKTKRENRKPIVKNHLVYNKSLFTD